MALKWFSLLALLLTLPAAADLRQAETCGNGRAHQAGFCPAVLSSPTSASVGSTTASCRATSDVGDGTQYCCMTSTSTPLSASGVATCSGGAAVAGANQAVSGSGVQTVPATGLTASTNYYAQSANLSPEQWYSNAVVSSQLTTLSEGGEPYDLSGFNLPFEPIWPTAPTITSSATVTPATLAANNVNGRRLTLQAGSYGDVSPANDQEWILQSGAVLGTWDYTGSARVILSSQTPRVGVVDRVTADEASGATQDILIDGITARSRNGQVPNESIWSSPNGQRVALVNSDLRSNSYVVYPVTNNASWSHHLIVAGNYMYTSSSFAPQLYGNQHVFRSYGLTNFIIAGNYLQKDDAGQTLRIHVNDIPAPEAVDGFIGGNTLAINSAGVIGLVIMPSSGNSNPGFIRRVRVQGNEIHNNGGGSIALQSENDHLYDSLEFIDNNAYGSLGLPGDLSSYNSTQSGNTESAYNSGNIPTAAAVLGWTP